MKINFDNVGLLRTLYDEAARCDKALFSEMRTNLMLRQGNHYNKSLNKIVDEFRRKGVISKDDKVRLTKNHIHRVTNEHANAIMTRQPDVIASPFDDGDLQDIKNAEMGNSVLGWIKESNNWSEAKGDYIDETVTVGEVYAFVKFDPHYGKKIGEETKEETNKETGLTETKKFPLMEGRVDIEKRFGFEVKRDPGAKTFDESRYVFLDKLMDYKDAEELVKRLKGIEAANALQMYMGGESTIEIYKTTGGYAKESGKVLLREMIVRPCNEYPKGKYILFSDMVKVLEMELPLGEFPLFQSGFDRVTTTPRCSSIIRVARPYQIEINRLASKMVEHQVTIGDDKIFTTGGGGIASSKNHNGIREFKVEGGSQPVVVPGRTGDQYLPHMDKEIAGLYQACGVDYLLADKAPQGGDPYAMLYRSMHEKAVFVPYVRKFEAFEKKVMTFALKLARAYLTEQHIIKIVGKKETVNVASFKALPEDAFDIKVEATSEDVESKFGKILTTTQVLQYTGSSMTPDQVGQLAKNLPYGNKGEAFNSLTLKYDTATNILLTLDKGGRPYISEYMDLEYLLPVLMGRMVKSDFPYLPQETQTNYKQLVTAIEQTKVQQLQQAQQAEMGQIPMGGFLVTCQVSVEVPDGKGGTKQRQLRVPSDALAWLSQKMQQQGAMQEQLSTLPPQARAEVAQMMTSQGQPQAAPNNNQPMPQASGAM